VDRRLLQFRNAFDDIPEHGGIAVREPVDAHPDKVSQRRVESYTTQWSGIWRPSA
jgi:hypothetical protein